MKFKSAAKSRPIDEITALGLMSGTSLDGLDMALCTFSFSGRKWKYKILEASTLPYPEKWKNAIEKAHLLNAADFLLLHQQFGEYIGNKARIFTNKNKIKPLFIASHGHTIFHQPGKHMTFQMGNGASVAATSGITTICDFRTFDVALGGQGAPLVPVGDELLFGDFGSCLNLGGFSNISLKINGQRKAYDICPVNFVLNKLANKQGMEYDKNGMLGRKGNIDFSLVNQLNNLGFYHTSGPKSLGREWVESVFMPVIENSDLSLEDQMRSVYEHICYQIVNHIKNDRVLTTGGGSHNSFLIELIQKQSGNKLYIPDKLTVDYKEALVFAFLGVLRYFDLPNCWSSVTGCLYDHAGGIIYKMNA